MIPWKEVAHSYPCPVCNAKPGDPCRTKSGNRSPEPHVPRAAQADRCPKCGERLPEYAEPAELCERCKLIRRLEIERSTTWQRRT